MNDILRRYCDKVVEYVSDVSGVPIPDVPTSSHTVEHVFARALMVAHLSHAGLTPAAICKITGLRNARSVRRYKNIFDRERSPLFRAWKDKLNQKLINYVNSEKPKGLHG